MINITLSSNPQKWEPRYPRLMTLTNGNGLIILCERELGRKICGTVISKGDSAYHVGHYAENWEASSFTDYNGSITIQNSQP